MLMKRPRHRIFDYTPRFYKPDQDEDERRKRKLGFRSHRHFTHKKRSPLIWLLFIIIVLFIIFKLATK